MKQTQQPGYSTKGEEAAPGMKGEGHTREAYDARFSPYGTGATGGTEMEDCKTGNCNCVNAKGRVVNDNYTRCGHVQAILRGENPCPFVKLAMERYLAARANVAKQVAKKKAREAGNARPARPARYPAPQPTNGLHTTVSL